MEKYPVLKNTPYTARIGNCSYAKDRVGDWRSNVIFYFRYQQDASVINSHCSIILLHKHNITTPSRINIIIVAVVDRKDFRRYTRERNSADNVVFFFFSSIIHRRFSSDRSERFAHTGTIHNEQQRQRRFDRRVFDRRYPKFLVSRLVKKKKKS